MSLAADASTGTLMVGTDRDSYYLFKINNAPNPMVLISSFEKNYGPTIVTTIRALRSNQENKQTFYVCGLANGMIKFFNTECRLVAELMGHSRSINAIVTPHYVMNEQRSFQKPPLFVTIGDDTMVNVWMCKFDPSGNLSDIDLAKHFRVPDDQLVGVIFGTNENSLIVAPYDFKFLVGIRKLF